MSRGCLSAQITVPTGDWTVSVTVTAIGTTSVVVAAGAYYHDELLAALQTALNGAFVPDGAFTVSSSIGEGGTGIVTIAHATQTFTLTWTSTDLRDCLGFTGTLTPAALTFTGTRAAQGIWLPDCPMIAKYGPNDAGHTESDMGQTISPRGDVQTTVYTTRVRNEVAWSHVSRARARIQGETVTGESFERFIRYTQYGELSYFAVGAPVRLIWDADTPGTYVTYRIVNKPSTEMERAVSEWIGLWPINVSLYVVPS